MREHEENDQFSHELEGTEKRLEVFITVLDKTMTYVSTSFNRQGAYFIQANHSDMHLLGDYRYVLTWYMGVTFALKNLEGILECSDDVARHRENLLQN